VGARTRPLGVDRGLRLRGEPAAVPIAVIIACAAEGRASLSLSSFIMWFMLPFTCASLSFSRFCAISV
jgi:tartrate dehydratase alpha subunit/fumarate hydratase class I-like protein